eukprot:211613_1
MSILSYQVIDTLLAAPAAFSMIHKAYVSSNGVLHRNQTLYFALFTYSFCGNRNILYSILLSNTHINGRASGRFNNMESLFIFFDDYTSYTGIKYYILSNISYIR